MHRRAVRARAEHLCRVGGGRLQHRVAHGFFYGGRFRARDAVVDLREGDARDLRGQHIAEVARLGDHIIIAVQFAEDAHEVFAFFGEDGRFFFRRDEQGCRCGFNFRKARYAFSGKAAFLCVLHQHIARVRRKRGAHMVKRRSFRRSDLVEHDQLVELAHVFISKLDLGRFCRGFGIEKDRAAHRDELERRFFAQQVFADARGNVYHGECFRRGRCGGGCRACGGRGRLLRRGCGGRRG